MRGRETERERERQGKSKTEKQKPPNNTYRTYEQTKIERTQIFAQTEQNLKRKKENEKNQTDK